MISNQEKERFCSFAAALFAPPDRITFDHLRQDELLARVEAYALGRGSDGQLREGFIREAGKGEILSALRAEYAGLFGERDGRVSLVESTYKPWTTDKGCRMVFAASKGLLMGDHALHMQELYRRASLEVPEEYRSTPDHLVLELEFLALLYRFVPDEAIGQFISDHLDWITELGEAVAKARPGSLYRGAIELLHHFLLQERENGKGRHHGQKKVH